VPKLLKLLLIAAFFNALSWVVLIPVWQYPDEQAHFAQVQDVAELGHVPFSLNTSREIEFSEKVLGTERDSLGNNKFTYHPEYKIEYSADSNVSFEDVIRNLPKTARSELVKHEATQNPPLYYFLGSIVYKIFYNSDLFTRVFAVRMMSLIIFLATIYLSYKIGIIIFKNNKFLSIVLASLVTFKPMLVFSSTGVLPDALTNLFFTAIIFLSLEILQEGLKKKYLIGFFAILIAGVMTRQHFLLVIPVILIPLTLRTIRAENGWKSLTIFLWSSIALVILATLYGTKIPLVSSFRIQEFTSIKFSQFSWPELSNHLSQVLSQFYKETFVWYWGVYKWLSLTLPLIYYRLIKFILIISLVGVFIKFYKGVKRKKLDFELLYLVHFILSSIFYLLIFVVWDYFFSKSSGYSFGLQGRYFFPLIVIHLAILLYGAREVINLLVKKYAKYATLTIVVLMIIFNDLSLFHVSSSYYDLLSTNAFIIQTSLYKPLLFKGNIILTILALNFILQLFLLINMFQYAIAVVDQKES